MPGVALGRRWRQSSRSTGSSKIPAECIVLVPDYAFNCIAKH